MLEGGSPLISGFEVKGRAPLDYKSQALSFADMATIRGKYEGLECYILKNTADSLSGKKYRLKPLADCGLTFSAIAQWGTDSTHWTLVDAAGVDLSAYAQNQTAQDSILLIPAPDAADIVPLDGNGKITLREAINTLLRYVKTLLSSTFTVSQTITTGDVNAVSGGAVADALAQKADVVDGKIPATQLPSYVDDVVEVATLANLPVMGESGKIYILTTDNRQFRWSGSQYAELTQPVDLSTLVSRQNGGQELLVEPDADVAADYVLTTGKGRLNTLFSALARKVKDFITSLSFSFNATLYYRLRRNTIIHPLDTASVIDLRGKEKFDRIDLVAIGSDREITAILGVFEEGHLLHLTNASVSSITLLFTHSAVFSLDGQIDLVLDKGDLVVFECSNGVFRQLYASAFAPLTLTLPTAAEKIQFFAAKGAFPLMGESDMLYVAKDTSQTFCWTGSVYTRLDEEPLSDYINKYNLSQVLEQEVEKAPSTKLLSDTFQQSVAKDEVEQTVEETSPNPVSSSALFSELVGVYERIEERFDAVFTTPLQQGGATYTAPVIHIDDPEADVLVVNFPTGLSDVTTLSGGIIGRRYWIVPLLGNQFFRLLPGGNIADSWGGGSGYNFYSGADQFCGIQCEENQYRFLYQHSKTASVASPVPVQSVTGNSVLFARLDERGRIAYHQKAFLVCDGAQLSIIIEEITPSHNFEIYVRKATASDVLLRVKSRNSVTGIVTNDTYTYSNISMLTGPVNTPFKIEISGVTHLDGQISKAIHVTQLFYTVVV